MGWYRKSVYRFVAHRRRYISLYGSLFYWSPSHATSFCFCTCLLFKCQFLVYLLLLFAGTPYYHNLHISRSGNRVDSIVCDSPSSTQLRSTFSPSNISDRCLFYVLLSVTNCRYILFTVSSYDKKNHNVQLYYDNTGEIAVNSVDEPVTWSK